MNNYCTLFDSNYLTRGLAMYQSICRTGEEFTLYVFCFDYLAYEILKKLNLKDMKLIKLSDFENDELLGIRADRSTAEYCWTCTPFVIRYCLDYFKVDEVTYLDSDLYFFYKPEVLLDEFHKTNNDVMITEHKYTKRYDQSETSGIYCVQFMTFRSNQNGLAILQWWQDRCIEWCYSRFEDGKFGDQKYLDKWTTMFKGVHVLKHIGGGVAPWNVQQYNVSEGPNGNGKKIIFYHFHALRWYENNKIDFCPYILRKNVKKYIYTPYIIALKEALKLIQTIDSSFTKGICIEKITFRIICSYIKRRITGTYNIIKVEQ